MNPWVRWLRRRWGTQEMLVVECDVMCYELDGACAGVCVQYFLLIIFGILENDIIAAGVYEFVFGDDGAEGSSAAGSH